MKTVETLIIGAELIFFAACAVILVFLIIRRWRIKKNEDFEKRDN